MAVQRRDLSERTLSTFALHEVKTHLFECTERDGFHTCTGDDAHQ